MYIAGTPGRANYGVKSARGQVAAGETGRQAGERALEVLQTMWLNRGRVSQHIRTQILVAHTDTYFLLTGLAT